MSQTFHSAKAAPRDYRIDSVKALGVFLVVIWHLSPIDIAIPNITKYGLNIVFKEALKAFYFQVTLVAVPVLFIISLYLYIGKLRVNGYQYLTARIQRLFSIYLFWLCCQIAVYYFITQPNAAALADWGFWNLPWYGLLQKGGPALPIVGDSVFYFLFVLMILTTLAALFLTGEKIRRFNDVAGILIIGGFLAFFEYGAFQGEPVPFLGTSTDFIVYVPIAYFIEKYGDRLKRSFALALFVFYVLFSVQDYLLREQGIPFGSYSRVSIVCGATSLFVWALTRKRDGQSKLVRFLSVYSLGIFALHKYFQYFATVFLNPLYIEYGVKRKIPVWELRINFQLMGIAALAILLTCAGVFLMARTPLKRFIQ